MLSNDAENLLKDFDEKGNLLEFEFKLLFILKKLVLIMNLIQY